MRRVHAPGDAQPQHPIAAVWRAALHLRAARRSLTWRRSMYHPWGRIAPVRPSSAWNTSPPYSRPSCAKIDSVSNGKPQTKHNANNAMIKSGLTSSNASGTTLRRSRRPMRRGRRGARTTSWTCRHRLSPSTPRRTRVLPARQPTSRNVSYGTRLEGHRPRARPQTHRVRTPARGQRTQAATPRPISRDRLQRHHRADLDQPRA